MRFLGLNPLPNKWIFEDPYLFTTASMRRVVVFLDIDGVLAPFPPPFVIPKGRIFPDDNLAALSTILEAFTEQESTNSRSVVTLARVDVVLSSTWRVQASFCQDILKDFRAYGRGSSPLSDASFKFWDITDPTMHTERQYEIYDWLNKETRRSTEDDDAIDAWICLDDEELLEGEKNARHKSHFQGHVIHCDSKKGLTTEQALEAIRLIRHQLSQT
jgi:HAD domain in Swiss Army Knife RNA repair proteins